MKPLFFLVILFFHGLAHAVVVDIGVTQFSHSFTQLTDTKTSQTFVNFSLMANITKGEPKKLNFGWTIISVASQVETSTSSEKLSSLDMGPVIRWAMDQRRLFVFTFAYGVYAKGKFDTLTTSEALTGTSLHAKFAIEPQVTDTFNLGVSLNYYAPSFNKAVLNATETDVSYKGSQIFPAISMAFHY